MRDGRQQRRNRVVMASLFGLVLGMGALSFAAVPLYDLFCRVTGYGGTTQVADDAPVQAIDRVVRVRFTGLVDRDLPWDFAPQQREVTLRVGEPGLAFYAAHNRTDRPVTGMAVYNVTPAKAGVYFNKIHCFCFDQQTLAAGESVSMPVQFFVDPAIDEDPGLDDVGTITLSYTFFRAQSDAANDMGGDRDNAEGGAAMSAAPPTTVAAAPDR